MAMHYENLPIYKKALELTVFMETIVKHFSRFHRYEIGADMRKMSRNLAALVIKANFSVDKVGAITELRDKSEEMKLTIVIGKEVKAFQNFRHFQRAAVLATDISRQSQGWLNSKLNKRPESSPAKRRGERAKDHCASTPPDHK
jgi:hypothetical protein